MKPFVTIPLLGSLSQRLLEVLERYARLDARRQVVGISDTDWQQMKDRAKRSWEPTQDVLNHEIQDYVAGRWPGPIYGTAEWTISQLVPRKAAPLKADELKDILK